MFRFRCGGPQFGVAQTRELGPHRVDLLDAQPVAVEHRMQPLQHKALLLITWLTGEGRYKESAGGGR
jgi:hypothetical protein